MIPILRPTLRFSVIALLVFVLAAAARSQDDRSLFAMRARELLQGGRVTILTTAPLREDLISASYVRFVSGAKVQFVYISNGEATTAGPLQSYPNTVAADLRGRAYAVAQALEAEHTFLNMPHVDAASDQEHVRLSWPADTLRARLRRALTDFRPDLLIVNGLDRPETSPYVASTLVEDLHAVLTDLRVSRRVVPRVVAIGEGAATGRLRTVKGVRTADGRPLVNVANGVRAAYGMLGDLIPDSDPIYSTMPGYPQKRMMAVTDPSRLLRRPRPQGIAHIDSAVRAVAGPVARWTTAPKGKAADRALRTLIGALAQIDAWFDAHPEGQDPERRILLDWRWALEAIRIRVLGVVPYVRVSDSVLTTTQLTYVTIDSIQGLDPKGQTQVIFPMVQQGWILNERPGDKAALVFGEPYRLISSRTMPFDLPRDLEGLERPVYRSPWYFFIVHWASVPERRFSLRVDAGFLGAPRFSAEVLSPIVVAADQEELTVRLTNNSRDGVRDTLAVREELVQSTPMFFRLNAKGSTEVDTLALAFDPAFPDGTRFVDVSIGRDPVARFLVRKFDVRADSSSPILVIAEDPHDATSIAVRRLGVAARSVSPVNLDSVALVGVRVVLVSEFAAHTISQEAWKTVQSSLRRGMRLVVLSQDPDALMAVPGDHQLTASVRAVYDTTAALVVDRSDRLWSDPNDLREESWDGWLYRRTSFALKADTPNVRILAVLNAENNPAVLRWSVGQGTVHYVNLNLGHQFLNVLPAAYRFLANLLAY